MSAHLCSFGWRARVGKICCFLQGAFWVAIQYLHILTQHLRKLLQAYGYLLVPRRLCKPCSCLHFVNKLIDQTNCTLCLKEKQWKGINRRSAKCVKLKSALMFPFCGMKRPGVFLRHPDWDTRVTPSIEFGGTICTPGWRGALWDLSVLLKRTQHNVPG